MRLFFRATLCWGMLCGFLPVFMAQPVYSQNQQPDALAEYRAGNYEQAARICQGEITARPRNLESYVVISWSLVRLGRYQEALQYARTGWDLNRSDVRIIEILGEIYYYLGQNDDALQYFQEYTGMAPEGQRVETAYYFIGEIYIRKGKYRHADIALSTAVHWIPGNAAWWSRLAYARENAGDLSEALIAYERALSLDPQHSDARRGVERVRQTLGRR